MLKPPYTAGFTKFTVDQREGAPIGCVLWYPSTATEVYLSDAWLFRVAANAAPATGCFPLVAVSHGTGGSWREFHGIAEHLARHGFAVLGLSHPGDSYDARSTGLPGGLEAACTRPSDVSRALNALLALPPYASILDGERVGVLGFSIGGYTAFVLAGARPDFRRLATHPESDPPSVYFEQAVEGGKVARELLRQAHLLGPDPRIRAVLAMAPALGFLFDAAGLKDVRVPVRLYRAEHDEVLRYPWDGEDYRRMLPVEPETVIVSGAGHYAFLPPAPTELAAKLPELFLDRDDFDRRGFHERLSREVEEFFRRTLSVAAQARDDVSDQRGIAQEV